MLVVAVMFIVVNLVIDLLVGAIDPRVAEAEHMSAIRRRRSRDRPRERRLDRGRREASVGLVLLGSWCSSPCSRR